MAALEVVHCYFTVAYLWFTFFSDYYSLYLLLRLLGDPLEEFYSWLSLVLQYSTSSINATTFVNQGSIYYCLIQLQAVPGSRSVWTSECRKGVASSNLERALSERKTAGRVPSPPFFLRFPRSVSPAPPSWSLEKASSATVDDVYRKKCMFNYCW